MSAAHEVDFDRINLRAYGSAQSVRMFRAASGWLEPGERAAMEYPLMAGATGPVLDIGIGGGRTVSLMRGMCCGYVGIDYTPELIDAARQRFPDVDLRQMDARRLDFPDDHFGLASFSFNGIDSVDLAGRDAILREVYRVLEPGGFFVFSSLNHHSKLDRVAIRLPDRPSWRAPCALMKWLLMAPVSLLNAIKMRRWRREGQDLSIRTVPALRCSLIAHYISVPAQAQQIHELGFELCAIYDNVAGNLVRPDDIAEGAAYLHYVVRKPSREHQSIEQPILAV